MRGIIWTFGQVLSPLVRRFHDALDHPQLAQRVIQTTLCDRLIASEYGASHQIRSVDDWQQLPIVDYDDIQPWVRQQIAHPHEAILTPDPILFCEKTSGSRGIAKSIPYTRSLRQSFSRLFCIWAQDLIRNGPAFSRGKVYFCVSPQLAEAQVSGAPMPDSAIQDALHDDSDYLEPWLQWILSPFLVMVPNIGRIRSAEEFKESLCLTLLREERLEIISVWSPSFITVQLAYIQQHRERLIQSLGSCISPCRRDALLADEIQWTEVWPHLKLISCWDSAAAADQADSVRSHFPGVYVQGKGLLATEAPMTVPLIKAQHNEIQGYLPLIDEVFFEFEEIKADGGRDVYLLHELEEGVEYQLIVSQKGGLYRYRMGDRVRVTHTYRNTPCLEFLGRSHTTSDMVGEKINSDFVAAILDELSLDTASFKSLVPVLKPQPHYLLLLDQSIYSEEAIAHQLEACLCCAHHYHHARLLGQLTPAQVMIAADIAERVTQRYIQNGQCWGDLKYSRLETKAWETLI